jgi:hypothetical protein
MHVRSSWGVKVPKRMDTFRVAEGGLEQIATCLSTPLPPVREKRHRRRLGEDATTAGMGKTHVDLS